MMLNGRVAASFGAVHLAAVGVDRCVDEAVEVDRRQPGGKREAGEVERGPAVVDIFGDLLVEQLERDIAVAREILLDVEVERARFIGPKPRIAAAAGDDRPARVDRRVDAIADRDAHLVEPRALDLLRRGEAHDEVARQARVEAEARQDVPIFVARLDRRPGCRRQRRCRCDDWSVRMTWTPTLPVRSAAPISALMFAWT